MRTLPALPTTVLLALAAGLPAAVAQDDPQESVGFEFRLEPAEAQPGQSVDLVVAVDVPAGWHIYSTGTTKGFPSGVTVTAPAGLIVGALSEPEPEVEELPYIGEAELHRGRVEFRQRLKLKSDLAPGTLEIPVSSAVQWCDDANTQCRMAEDQAQLELTVTAAAEPAPEPAPGADPGEGDEPDEGHAGDGQEPGLGFDGPGVGFDLPGLEPAGEETLVQLTAALLRRVEQGQAGEPLGDSASVPPGARLRLELTIEIVEGWHVYATRTRNGTPTLVKLALPPGVSAYGELQDTRAPKVHTTPGVGDSDVHDGTVSFTQDLVVDPDLAASELLLGGTLEWQHCDDANTECRMGQGPFELTLAVAGEAVAPPPPLGETGSAPAVEAAEAEPLSLGDLLKLAGGAFLLGLAMLLQPCTLPMIPITVSIFSKGKQLSRGQSILRAGVYAVGIILSFVVITGLVLIVFGIGGQGGLNALAANPWLNLAIGLLFVYFAFSFFGYYELSMDTLLYPLTIVGIKPGQLVALGQAKVGADGTVPMWSLFLMGLFFVITSYTCGAPIVLALFTGAASAAPDPLAVIFATFVFATVVAAPYFLLALAPGLVRALPKSGSWFSVFKVVLGALELGFALKFLRGFDVFKLNVLSVEVIYGTWAVLGALCAVYLAGLLPFSFPHDPKLRPVTSPRALWAAVFLAGAIWFGGGALDAWDMPGTIDSFLLRKPSGSDQLNRFSAAELAEAAGVSAEQAQAVVNARQQGKLDTLELEKLTGLGLEPEVGYKVLAAVPRLVAFGDESGKEGEEGEEGDVRLDYRVDQRALEEGLARAKADGLPGVFVLFTGHNCVNCKLMEDTVLQDPRVEALLEGVPRLALFIDTPGDPLEGANNALLQERFNTATIPSFFVLDADGNETARQIGGTGQPGAGAEEAFIEFLERGGLGQPSKQAKK